MPYSGANDPDLPSNVQKLSTKKKKQWVAIFNSTYSSCISDGGEKQDCEGKAFRIANGTIKKAERSFSMSSLNLEELFKKFMQFVNQERAVSTSQIFQQLYESGQLNEERGYPLDIYLEDDGSAFVLFNQGGKLFRAQIDMSSSDVALTDSEEVLLDFVPIKRSAFRIIRQSDGRSRWVSTSCTSVINRVGEIDSTELFDSFVKYCERTGNYPYRTFFHKGEQFRTGVADFVARDGNVLVTSGLYDESEIAEAEIKARETEPDYWGESIKYHSEEKPEFIESEGIKIPVYRSGWLEEISTLPEELAASFYTNRTIIEQEVNRAMKDKEMQAFIKLFGSEEKAREWLESNVDELNRMIDTSGAIARGATDTDDVDTDVSEGDLDEKEEDIVTDDVSSDTDDGDTSDDIEQELIIDDEAVARIAEAITATEAFASVAQSVTQVSDSLEVFRSDLNELRAAHLKMIQDLKERVDSLSAEEEERKREWMQDLPRNAVKTRVNYRPSKDASDANADDDASLQDIAAKTLEGIR